MKALILFLLITSLYGIDYDNLLLRAQSSMYPKILLLDKNIGEKLTDSAIQLSVVYEDEEVDIANAIKNLIEEKYNGKVGKYQLNIKLLHVNNFSEVDTSSAYYFLDLSNNKKESIIAHAVLNNRICFSYDYKDFDKNTLISLFLKEKTYIYLNKSVLSDYNIKFIPIFYNIAKVR